MTRREAKIEKWRKSRSYGERKQSLKHAIEKCRVIGRRNDKVEELLGIHVRRNLAKVHEIMWKRERTMREGVQRTEGKGAEGS